MADTYTSAPTRTGADGVKDKLALISAMADKYAHNREFAERVLYIVRGAGNGADAQVEVWEKYLESLPYRRELAEVLRNPIQTLKSNVGGDCDDLTVVALAGLRSLGLRAVPQIIARPNGDGFHVRALVALPPLKPTHWRIIDPVWRSERQWAMIGKPIKATGCPPLDTSSVSRTEWKKAQAKAGPHWLLQIAVAILAFKTVDAVLPRPR